MFYRNPVDPNLLCILNFGKFGSREVCEEACAQQLKNPKNHRRQSIQFLNNNHDVTSTISYWRDYKPLMMATNSTN